MQELLEIMEEPSDDPQEQISAVQEITSDLEQNMTRIVDNCDRASRIIQDVTNMSRTTPGEPRPVEINKMLHDYAILAYQAARSQDQSFNVRIEENLDPDVQEVMCVPEDMSRVFINIASNACYATRQKSLDPATPAEYAPTMKLVTKRHGQKVVVSIRDNGNGIPDEVRDKIFHPFFTTKPTNEGTGLGLSLSHEIVRHHGGNITVDSEPGQYTEIRIELAATQAAAPTARPVLTSQITRERKRRVRSCRGRSKNSSGDRSSTTRPWSNSSTRSATSPREAHFVRDGQDCHARLRQVPHHVQHLSDHLRVQPRRRFVKKHHAGTHGQSPRYRHPLLLPAGELVRKPVRVTRHPHHAQR